MVEVRFFEMGWTLLEVLWSDSLFDVRLHLFGGTPGFRFEVVRRDIDGRWLRILIYEGVIT